MRLDRYWKRINVRPLVRSMKTQKQMHKQSLVDSNAFWLQSALELVSWKTPPSAAHVKHNWFQGATLNTCYNAVDRHVVAGRGNQLALVHDSAYTNSVTQWTYDDLLVQVSRFANVLKKHGVRKGHTVIIYMPVIPEAIVAMLACARIGAIHSVVFGGFAAPQLAKRIADANPAVIVYASYGIEPHRVIQYSPFVDEALRLAGIEMRRIVLRRDTESIGSSEYDWSAEMASVSNDCEPQVMDATDPLYILFTSGSTGKPKGVVRDNGGHAVAVSWSIKHVFGLKPGECFFAASDIGWVLGHSFMLYGPLIAGCTSVLYEGKPVGTPDAGVFWSIVQRHRVNVLFAAPTAIRAIKRDDPTGALSANYRLDSLRALFLAGERSDTDTIEHFRASLRVPVIDNYWQTETGWPVTAAMQTSSPLTATDPRTGSGGLAVPGFDVRVLIRDKEGTIKDAAPNKSGNLAIKLPLPPGTLLGLWNDDSRFHSSYLAKFPGYFDLGDEGYMDDDGYFYIMSRTDDVLNCAGHRLSSGSIEEAIAFHSRVAETAVVGLRDALKGEVPCAFVVLKDFHSHTLENLFVIRKQIIDLVRQRVGPVASFHTVYFVHKLPKTRSGKILRRTLRSILHNEPFTMPATIENEAVCDEVASLLATQKNSRI